MSLLESIIQLKQLMRHGPILFDLYSVPHTELFWSMFLTACDFSWFSFFCLHRFQLASCKMGDYLWALCSFAASRAAVFWPLPRVCEGSAGGSVCILPTSQVEMETEPQMGISEVQVHCIWILLILISGALRWFRCRSPTFDALCVGVRAALIVGSVLADSSCMWLSTSESALTWGWTTPWRPRDPPTTGIPSPWFWLLSSFSANCSPCVDQTGPAA